MLTTEQNGKHRAAGPMFKTMEIPSANFTKLTPLRIPKVANLSDRLDPNFDPKFVNKKSENSPPKTHKNDEELDPNTVDFRTVVQFLDPNFITTYLQKVLSFLESSKTELCFPIMAPYKVAFLMKITRNHNYLNSSLFSKASKGVASKVLAVLKANKDVFQWSCTYDIGTSGNCRVLVYKKHYFQQQKQLAIGNHPPSTRLMSYSMVTTEPQQHMKESEISTRFKVQMLNSTLRFLKDDSQLVHEYPQMLRRDATFLSNMITQRNDESIGLGFKSLYSSLNDIVRRVNENYELKMLAVDENEFTVRMILRKVPKATRKSREKSETNKSPNQPECKVYQKVKLLLKSLPVERIRVSLQTIVDFIDDEASASLVFRYVGKDEMTFLESVISISKKRHFDELFPADCIVLLQRISQKHPWHLQLNTGRVNKKNGVRDMTFNKTPRYSQRRCQLQPSPTSPLISKVKDTVDTSAVPESLHQSTKDTINTSAVSKSLHQSTIDTINTSAVSKSLHQSTIDTINTSAVPKSLHQSTIDTINTSAVPKSLHQGAVVKDTVNTSAVPKSLHQSRKVKDTVPKTLRKTIDFQMADTGEGGGDNTCEKDRARPVAADKKKQQMIDAMSVPLEIDRAQRMMRKMGWEGGALGVRGGITEPIMPALHLATRAGFGHVRPAKQAETNSPKRPTTQQRVSIKPDKQILIKQPDLISKTFRREYFFQYIITLINSDVNVVTLSYNPALSITEMKYLQRTLTKLNGRKSFKIAKVNQHILETVFRLMMTCDYVLELGFTNDMFKITLKKILNPIYYVNNQPYKTHVDPTSYVDNIPFTPANPMFYVDHRPYPSVNHPIYHVSNRVLSEVTCVSHDDSKKCTSEDDECQIVEEKMDVISISDDDALEKSFADANLDVTRKEVIVKKVSDDFATKNEIAKEFIEHINVVNTSDSESVQKSTFDKDSSGDINDYDDFGNDETINNEVLQNFHNNDDIKEVSLNGNADNVVCKGEITATDVLRLSRVETDQTSTVDLENKNENNAIDFLCLSQEEADQKSSVNLENKSENTAMNVLEKADQTSTVDIENKNENTAIDVQCFSHEKSDETSTVDIESNNKNTAIDVLRFSHEKAHKALSVNPENKNENTAIDVLCFSHEADVQTSSDLDIGNKNDKGCNDLVSDWENIADDSMEFASKRVTDIVTISGLAKEPDSGLTKNKVNNHLIAENVSKSNKNLVEKCDTETKHNITLINIENVKVKNATNYPYDDVSIKIDHGSINTENLSISSKRSRIDSNDFDTLENLSKRHKQVTKTVLLTAKGYPTEKLTKIIAMQIQKIISNKIDDTPFLPYLECLGFKNGVLKYSCHNEHSVIWLKDSLKNVNINVLNTEIFEDKLYKLTIRLNSYINVDAMKVFDRLELYNAGLNTSDWLVTQEREDCNYVEITVVVNEESFEYICACNFKLFAGIDRAKFSVVWDY